MPADLPDDATSNADSARGSSTQTESIVARPASTLPTPLPAVADPLALPNYRKRDAIRDLGQCAVMLLGFQAVVELGIVAVQNTLDDPGSEFDDIQRHTVLPLIAYRSLLVFAVLGLVLRKRRMTWRTVGIASRSVRSDLLWGVAAFAAQYLVILSWLLFCSVYWPGWFEDMGENAEILVTLLPPMSPWGMALLSGAVGLYEELLFRGFILTRLHHVLGRWTPAVILTTAVFVAPHALEQTPAALIPIAFLSIIFSLFTIWRRSILPAVVGHALFDFSQLLGLMYQYGDRWS